MSSNLLRARVVLFPNYETEDPPTSTFPSTRPNVAGQRSMHKRSIVFDLCSSFLPRSSFICAPCRSRLASTRRFSSDGTTATRRRLPRLATTIVTQRHASSAIPATAINVRRTIPSSFQQLHASLGDLERDAGVYIDPSQLRLARRGLESEDAVTRVASTYIMVLF